MRAWGCVRARACVRACVCEGMDGVSPRIIHTLVTSETLRGPELLADLSRLRTSIAMLGSEEDARSRYVSLARPDPAAPRPPLDTDVL